MFRFLKKMIFLFTARERKQLYWLFFGMFVMALIDLASIGSIMPFMAVITNPEVIMSNKWLYWCYVNLRFESTNAFLLCLGVVVLVALVISNISAALITWLIFKFSWMRNHSLARRLFVKYLHEPYVFFLNRNSAELEKNILDEVQLVIVGIINPVLMIVKNSVVVVFIFSLLVFIEPTLALIVSLTLGSAYCALFFFTGKVLSKIGWERAEANKKRFRTANEALSGVKILKVLGREKFFIDSFSEHSFLVSNNFAKKAAIAQLPKHAFEVVAFGGVLLIIIYFLATQKDMSQIIPLLSLYAFAGYRLMPAMQTIFTKAANIKYSIPSLDIIYADLNKNNYHFSRQIKKERSVMEPVKVELGHEGIQIKDIRFSYPDQKLPVLDSFNLSIPPNKTIGLAGSTGSGKTTIIDILLGLLEPERGVFQIGNVSVETSNMRSWQQRVGYVPQDIFLLDDTVRRNIAFGIEEKEIDDDAVIKAAEIANLHEFVSNELPNSYDTDVGERGIRLSGGQKQRIGIARALYHDPEVLILDEATSALDGVTEDAIMQAIYNLTHKKTIIMIAHRLTTLQECDEIFVLDRGKVVASGNYHELKNSSAYFQEIEKLNKK